MSLIMKQGICELIIAKTDGPRMSDATVAAAAAAEYEAADQPLSPSAEARVQRGDEIERDIARYRDMPLQAGGGETPLLCLHPLKNDVKRLILLGAKGTHRLLSQKVVRVREQLSLR